MTGREGLRRAWRRVSAGRGSGATPVRREVKNLVADARWRHAALIQQAGQLVGRRRAAQVEAREAAAAAARVERGVRWAIVCADEARAAGRGRAAVQFDELATRLADELVVLERRAAVLEAAARTAASAADEGQRLVQVDAQILRRTLGEAARMVLQLDETTLLESARPSDTVDATIEAARERIEGRYARALAESELYGRGPF